MTFNYERGGGTAIWGGGKLPAKYVNLVRRMVPQQNRFKNKFTKHFLPKDGFSFSLLCENNSDSYIFAFLNRGIFLNYLSEFTALSRDLCEQGLMC